MTREQVIEAICDAIIEGRNENPEDHFHFPSDCFCTEHPGWNFEYDQHFLAGIKHAVRKFAATYANAKRWEDPT